MTNTIKAIETRYKGYRFRSRLEARWAVFFDALQIKWEFEVQGFVTPFGPYLPDFWFPTWGVFGECKPNVPAEDRNKDGYLKAQTFAGFNGQGAVIGLIGTPSPVCYPIWIEEREWKDARPDPRGVRMEHVDFVMSLAVGRLCLFGEVDPSTIDQRALRKATNKFDNALLLARGARFEHGESGGA